MHRQGVQANSLESGAVSGSVLPEPTCSWISGHRRRKSRPSDHRSGPTPPSLRLVPREGLSPQAAREEASYGGGQLRPVEVGQGTVAAARLCVGEVGGGVGGVAAGQDK